MKALILAAGEGTRLRPLTDELPKPLLPVAGRPLLEHTIEGLRREGLTDVAINLHHRADAIASHLGDGSRFGVRITYSREQQLLGTAGATKPLASFLDETFVVIYGDVLTDLRFRDLIEFHRKRNAELTLALYRVDNPTAVGLVGLDETGRVERFVEKPRPEQVFTDLANAGVLVCEPEVLERIPADRPYDFGHDLLPDLLANGRPVYGKALDVGEYLIDVGTPAHFLQAQVEWAALERGRRPSRELHVSRQSESAQAGPLIDRYLCGLERTVRGLSRESVVEVVGLLMQAWRAGRKVLLAGNGGSAATAAHSVNDLCKLTLTDGWPRLQAVALGDNVPLVTAWGNDVSYERVFAEPLLSLADPGDVFVAISTSGNSPNVLEAAAAARSRGAVIVAFTGCDGGRLGPLADHCIQVPSDQIGHQEDVHQVLDHVVAGAMRTLAGHRPPGARDERTDGLQALDFVEDYLERLERTLRELSRDAVARIVGVLMQVWQDRGKVLLAGNGGSAATASHMVNDLSKLTLTAGWPRLRALSLCDNVPLLTAWANDTSYDRVFAEPLLSLADPGDVFVAISTSGNSPNVLSAVEAARSSGVSTVGFTGRDGGRLNTLVDHVVRVPSDHIGRQEDVHLVLEHAITHTMRALARLEIAEAGPRELAAATA